MTAMHDTAMAFFVTCETGKGWDGCKQHCRPEASFHCQADALAKVTTLEGYCNWMQKLFTPMPDANYTLKSFVVDEPNHSATAYAVFHGTHTGDGGPVPATNLTTNSDYVYVMQFEGDKISHMTKIWNAGWALNELGWA